MAKDSFLVTCALAVLCVDLVQASGWSYHGADGPSEWSVHYPLCGGNAQSPIDIQSSSAVYSSGLTLNFINYDVIGTESFTVINNGHSVVVKVAADARIGISGGRLPSTFALDHLHFHWGSDDTKGAEHTINGKAFPLEIHLVHYNSDLYVNVSTAADKPNGLAVLGILVDVNSAATEIEEVNYLISHFLSVSYDGESTTVPPFRISALLPTYHKYYRYQGSLTTPECFETVTWSVFASKIEMAPHQLFAFRELFTNFAGEPDEPMVDNFRPVQPLNGRSILKSAP